METPKEFKQRVSLLRIPPNWKNVNISKDPTDYLQVTGEDIKGKIQYIYHPLFIELTTKDKFKKMTSFANFVPKLNDKINKDLKKGSIHDKEYLIAFMFKLLQLTYMRIGNEVYANNNKTYGLTTLQKKHFKYIPDKGFLISFIGKRYVKQEYTITNKYAITVLKKLLEFNSKGNSKGNIFQYYDKEQNCEKSITSGDMNFYLQETNNEFSEEFTCKDFRTYISNIYFIDKLKMYVKEHGKKLDDIKLKKKIVNKVYEEVAQILGHSKAISKKAYIFPGIAEFFIENHNEFKLTTDTTKLLNEIIKLRN